MISSVGRQRRIHHAWRACAIGALKVAGALALVVLLGRYRYAPGAALCRAFWFAEVFSAVALFLVLGFGLAAGRGWAVNGDGRVPRRAFCWRKFGHRLKAILNL